MRTLFACALILACSVAWADQPGPSAPPRSASPQAEAMNRAGDAVVGLRASAIEDARSSATLGPKRQGSGVVIGADGLVVTIGYLVLEAQDVLLLLDDGREVPARPVAYDSATGFGLVRALVPLKLDPVPLGQARQLSPDEPLFIVTGGAGGAASLARLVSRRAFSGNWEYHIDEALFTSPPRSDHSGAGLFNGHGELVGIGSLWVANALGTQGSRSPGNMFVPIDLLEPVLPELLRRGTSGASDRPWLGLNCTETEAGLRVTRVAEDSPADVAGLEAGDTIQRIDGAEVATLAQLWKALWAGGSSERDVQLGILRKNEPRSLTVRSVDRLKTLRRAAGV